MLGSAWRGVYPLDRIRFLENGGYVVNTQTSSLPGEHWIAIYVKPYNVSVFDPLGFYYPSLLVNIVSRMRSKLTYNYIRYQDPLTLTCGQHCLAWLLAQAV